MGVADDLAERIVHLDEVRCERQHRDAHRRRGEDCGELRLALALVGARGMTAGVATEARNRRDGAHGVRRRRAAPCGRRGMRPLTALRRVLMLRHRTPLLTGRRIRIPSAYCTPSITMRCIWLSAPHAAAGYHAEAAARTRRRCLCRARW